MITSCVILAKEGFVNLTVLQLDGIQDILHDFNHCSTALIARLDYVQKSLPLEYPAHTTVDDRNVPGDASLTKPVGLGLSVFLWKKLHGPVVNYQDSVVVKFLQSIYSRLVWLADLRMWHFQDIMAS